MSNWPGDVSVDLLSDDGDLDDFNNAAFFTPAPAPAANKQQRGGVAVAASAGGHGHGTNTVAPSPTPRPGPGQPPTKQSSPAKNPPPRLSMGGYSQEDLHARPHRESLSGRPGRPHADGREISPAVSSQGGSQQTGGNAAGNPGIGLKQTEKLIDDLKKENFSLKLKIYYLEEKLEKTSPGGMLDAIKENAEYKATIHQLTLDRDAILADLDNATNALLRAQDEAAMASDDAAAARAECDRLLADVDALREDLGQATRGIERMARDREEMAATLNALAQEKEDLEQSLESERSKAAQFASDLDDLEAARQADHAEMEKLQVAVEAAEAVAKDAEQEAGEAKEAVRVAEAENERLVSELETREGEMEGLRTRIASLEDALTNPTSDPAATARLAELESLLSTYKEEKDRLKSHYEFRISSLLADMEEVESEKEAAKLEASTAVQESAQLREDLKHAREQLSSLQQESSDALQEANAMREEASALRDEAAAARKETIALRNDAAQARSESQTARAEAKRLREQNEELSNQVIGLSDSNLKTSSSSSAAEAESALLRDRLAELQDAVERMESELENERAGNAEEVKRLTLELEQAKSELRESRRQSRNQNQNDERFQRAQERVETLQGQLEECVAQIEQLEEQKASMESKIASLQEQLAKRPLATASPAQQQRSPRKESPLKREMRTPPGNNNWRLSGLARSLGNTPREEEAEEDVEVADEHFEEDVAKLQAMINNLQERFGPEIDDDLGSPSSRRSSLGVEDPEQQTMVEIRNILYGSVRVALKFAKELKEEKTANRKMRQLYEKDDSLWRAEIEDREVAFEDYKAKYESLLLSADAKETAMQEELQQLLVQLSEMKANMVRADADATNQAKRMLEEVQSYRARCQSAEGNARMLEQENNALKDQIDDMDNVATSLKAELSETQRRSDDNERRFQETVTAGERERKALNTRNQQLQDEIAALQASLANIRQQQEGRIQQYQEDVEALAQQREQARLEAVRLRAEVEALQQQLSDYSHRQTRESATVAKENERLAADLGHANATVKELRATLAAYESNVATLGAANETNVRELNQQAARMDELEGELARLQHVCESQARDIQSWEESATQMQAQLKAERQRHHGYSAQTEELRTQVEKQRDMLDRVERHVDGILKMTGGQGKVDVGRPGDVVGRLSALEGWVTSVQESMVDAISACRRKIRSLESSLQTQFGNLDDLENIAQRANGKQQQLSELFTQTSVDLERTQGHVTTFKDQLSSLQAEIDNLLQSRNESSSHIRMLDQRVKAAEARAQAAERNLGGLSRDTNAQVRELELQLRTSEEQMETLSAQLQDAEERLRLERQGAKSRVSELLENSKKQQKLNDVLEAKSQSLARKLEDLEREHQTLVARFKASLGAESEATTRQLLEAREQLHEMRTQLENERETWRRLDGELGDLRGKYKRLKAQYERREQLVKDALESLVAIQEKKEVGALSVVTQHAAKAERLLKEAAAR